MHVHENMLECMHARTRAHGAHARTCIVWSIPISCCSVVGLQAAMKLLACKSVQNTGSTVDLHVDLHVDLPY